MKSLETNRVGESLNRGWTVVIILILRGWVNMTETLKQIISKSFEITPSYLWNWKRVNLYSHRRRIGSITHNCRDWQNVPQTCCALERNISMTVRWDYILFYISSILLQFTLHLMLVVCFFKVKSIVIYPSLGYIWILIRKFFNFTPYIKTTIYTIFSVHRYFLIYVGPKLWSSNFFCKSQKQSFLDIVCSNKINRPSDQNSLPNRYPLTGYLKWVFLFR